MGGTIAIGTVDNGGGGGKRGGGGARPIQGGKGSVWEGGIRVPLIVRGPGIEAGSWCHERVVGFDLFPTFCALAGVKEPLPKGVEGGNIAKPIYKETFWEIHVVGESADGSVSRIEAVASKLLSSASGPTGYQGGG